MKYDIKKAYKAVIADIVANIKLYQIDYPLIDTRGNERLIEDLQEYFEMRFEN